MRQHGGFTGFYQGQNFLELSEGIASVNFREFMRNNPDSRDFKNSIFCSFPGNDMLMDLFLQQFEKNKNLYECNMMNRVGKILSCDHTFKTSKYIGVTRDGDHKFVRQFQNVFLGLNENGEVLTWRFMKSTASSEIQRRFTKNTKKQIRQEGKHFRNGCCGRLLSCGKRL